MWDIKPLQKLLQALAFVRLRIEQEQTTSLRIPTPHVGHDEQARPKHLDDRSRKYQPVFFACYKAGAIAWSHADAKLGKRQRRLSTLVVVQRIAAFLVV